MIKQTSLFVLFFFSISVFAQKRIINGKIYDSETKEVLAFANVISGKEKGTISNAEGQFSIKIDANTQQLIFSYIGFEKKTLKLQADKNNYTIYLNPAVESLGTVVISGKYVDPALVLMKRIIKQKSKNDYRNKLKKYSYIKYYKFLVTANPDSINDAIDTIYYNGKIKDIDSSQFELKKELKNKDVYVMESVIKTNGFGGSEKNNVIASRTAGFNNPIYELLALQVASHNVYDDNYKILIKNYLGPLTNLSLKQYQYEIDDTINIQNRAVIVLSYLNTKKPLISGKIFVDKQSLAIAKMTLNTFKQFELQTTHEFTYYPKEAIWFPREANMKINKAKKKEGLALADGAIRITDSKKTGDSIKHTNNTDALDYLYAISKTKYLKINLGNLFQEKIKYDMQVAENASSQPAEFWKDYRDPNKVKREERTYQFIDSVAKIEGLEKKINRYRKLAQGYYSLGFFDLDLMHLLDNNQYESYRVSLGGKTNKKISKKVNLETYIAYGFKDKEVKYHAQINYKLKHLTQSYLNIAYTNDLFKTASFLNNSTNSFGLLSNLTSEKFYMGESFTLGATHLISKSLKASLQVSNQKIEIKHLIPPNLGKKLFSSFYQTDVSFNLEYQPFTKFFLGQSGREVLTEAFPIFYFNVKKSLPINTYYDFYRFDFQTYYKKTYLNKDTSVLDFKIGLASNNAPIIHLYSPQSNKSLKLTNNWLRTNQTSFETINDLEFVDNLVATLYLNHTFSKIKLSKKYNFDLSLRGGIAWGSSYRSNSYLQIKSLNSIYYETGIEFNRLLKVFKQGLGIGVYYRLGHYSYEKPIDNLSIKMSFTPSSLF
jgi:hypothetical protein